MKLKLKLQHSDVQTLSRPGQWVPAALLCGGPQANKATWVFLLPSSGDLATWPRCDCSLQFSWPSSLEMIRFLPFWQIWDLCYFKLCSRYDFIEIFLLCELNFQQFHTVPKGPWLVKVLTCLCGADSHSGVTCWGWRLKRTWGQFESCRATVSFCPEMVLHAQGAFWILGHLLQTS